MACRKVKLALYAWAGEADVVVVIAAGEVRQLSIYYFKKSNFA
jgi:hypothetical protein